jgi:hypothetical protein
MNSGDLLAALVNFLAISRSYQGDEKGLQFPHQGEKPYRRHPGERGCAANVIFFVFPPFPKWGQVGL